jgi:hypothetical protein
MEKVLHWLRWVFEPRPSGLVAFEPKRWRVDYGVDGCTIAMSYRSAWNLKKIHGGNLKKA